MNRPNIEIESLDFVSFCIRIMQKIFMIHSFGNFAIEKRCRIVLSQPSYRRAWRPAILLDSGKSSDSARLHLTAHLRKKCHLVIHPPNALYATGLIIQLWSSSLALPGRPGRGRDRAREHPVAEFCEICEICEISCKISLVFGCIGANLCK